MLEQIIPILEKDGWCKGLLVDNEGKKCLLGAINFAYTGDAHWPSGSEQEKMVDDIKALSTTIQNLFPDRTSNFATTEWTVAKFNNNDATTFEDIKLVVNKAMELQVASA